MSIFSTIADKFAGSATESVVKGIGKGVGSLMNRFGFVEKMSESEKWEKAKDIMGFETEQGKLEVEDVNKSREMWMTFMRTQKMPWVARFLNSIYRPFCGFVAILYLTDQFWAQILEQFISGFQWTLIERDPVVDGLVAVVVYFFFGYRQRSKEKGVANIS